MTPRISVVTPSYNQGQFIEETMRSVLLQRYPDVEYIVMDGGSTDQTTRIMERYASFLAYAVSERDGGQSDAIRRGFERSTGDIMAYLNSDDVLAPDALQTVAAFFAAHPRVDVLYSNRIAMDEGGKVIWYWILPPHSDYLMKRWDLIPQETCFWRRRIYERVGGIDASYRFAMDYDLFARFMTQGGRSARLRRFLGAFRQHGAAKTSVLLESIGQAEIARVWSRHRIKGRYLDPVIGQVFQRGVQVRSYVYGQTQERLPGSLPGLGWDYADVWGGELRGIGIPPLGTPAASPSSNASTTQRGV